MPRLATDGECVSRRQWANPGLPEKAVKKCIVLFACA